MTKFEVFGYPDETLSRVFDISSQPPGVRSYLTNINPAWYTLETFENSNKKLRPDLYVAFKVRLKSCDEYKPSRSSTAFASNNSEWK